MTHVKSRVIRKILKLKRKLDAQYPPDQAKLLFLAQFIEKIARYSTCLNWKLSMIRISNTFRGLVIGTEKYLRIISDHNPPDWISPLDPEIPIKVRKIGTQKHYILQILRLVSLTHWTLKIPKTPEELNIVYLGMILIDEKYSDVIVERIPEDYFFLPEVMAKLLNQR